MTVYLMDSVRRYCGLAADTKPTHGYMSTEEAIPPGSEFLEIDTNKRYVWSSTGWILCKIMVSTSWG